MTSTDRDLARRAVARNSENFFDEHMLSDMLGLMNDTVTVTEIWTASSGETIEAPAHWTEEEVMNALNIRGYAFHDLFLLRDIFTEQITPDITL